MAYRIIILPGAAEDISSAVKWYGTKNKALANDFVKNVKAKALLLAKNPKAFAIRYANVRTLPMQIFPYMIHYQADDARNEIIILAVLHTSKKPELWEEK